MSVSYVYGTCLTSLNCKYGYMYKSETFLNPFSQGGDVPDCGNHLPTDHHCMLHPVAPPMDCKIV